MDPFPTKREIQKLMYFIQESGTSLGLNYIKTIDGPHAENLNDILDAANGHFISMQDGAEGIELIPGNIELARNTIDPDTRERTNRVSDLIEGFESPFGLFLLARTHWAVTKVDDFSDDREPFTSRQVEIAYNWLKEKKWIDTNEKSDH
jgi:hypothetical protein